MLFGMFKVRATESEAAADAVHAPAQQQQQQQQQAQQAQQQQDKQESSLQANSSTESEHSMVSGESGEASPGIGAPATLWGADTPRRQRALSVDVPTEAPFDTPRRRSAPEVVVTHVAPQEDDAHTQASQGVESREGSPTQAYPHTPSPSSPGRLSPTTTLVPTSPPRSPRRLSRPLSRIAHGSLAFRKGSTGGAAQQQDSVTLTEITAPLEDSRSVLDCGLPSPTPAALHPLTPSPLTARHTPPHAALFTVQ
ncbi:hypothetical protein E2C01_084528 [Portunus trituberculatus]|uniref:Uncharacterized protein n=1 Tax=Portunus trituberculatus TaxID=210409 RepID=A0A5B7JAZ9_PORTR|nr:hypothetical protein [Portunus trituberculatus]